MVVSTDHLNPGPPAPLEALSLDTYCLMRHWCAAGMNSGDATKVSVTKNLGILGPHHTATGTVPGLRAALLRGPQMVRFDPKNSKKKKKDLRKILVTSLEKRQYMGQGWGHNRKEPSSCSQWYSGAEKGKLCLYSVWCI